MNRSLKNKMTTMLLTFAMLTSATSSVFAADWYLEDGDVTVSATDAGQTVTQGDTTENDDDPVIRNRDPETATDHTVTVETEDGASANITIEDVNIVCKYCGRGNGDAADCDLIYVEFADTVYPICAACGTIGHGTMELAEDVVCRMGKTTLAENAVIVREKEEPFGWSYGELDGYTDKSVRIDHIFTVTMNNEEGSLEDPEEEMTVKVKYSERSHYLWGDFRLVQLLADGTWVEIDFDYSRSDDTLMFETVEAGVFVIAY